jgi:hypothetical protein
MDRFAMSDVKFLFVAAYFRSISVFGQRMIVSLEFLRAGEFQSDFNGQNL